MNLMNPKSASSLNWGAALCCLLGAVVMSPSAGFMLSLIGIAMAAFPAAFSNGASRAGGVILLLIASALAWQVYPKFDAEMQAYRERAATRAAAANSAARAAARSSPPGCC